MIGSDGRVLLSRAGIPLAVAMLRPIPAGYKPEPVWTLDEAKAGAASASDAALKDGEEKIREFSFVLPTGNPKDSVGLLLRAHKISLGTRMLVLSDVYGPKKYDLAPGETLAPPKDMEIAIQFFNDAEGQPPRLSLINGERAEAPPAGGDAPGSFRAWSFELEGKSGFRVCLARSAPADWTIDQSGDALLLRAKLRSDPHEPGGYGSFILYMGAGADEAPPELSAVSLTGSVVPARDFIEGYARVYASGANPFVLSQLAVVAEVALPPLPDGKVPIKRLPCFLWEAPRASPREAPAEGEFRFRFAAAAEGMYGLRLAVVSATGEANADAKPFRTGPPASGGFARFRGDRLRLDDGAVFVPVGCNVEADHVMKPDDYRRSFVTMDRNDANAARIRLTDKGLPMESQKAGAFDSDALNAIDEVLRAAQARDIRLIVSFESGVSLGKNSEKHLYFREMGGPLSASPEFFRNAAAKKLFQDKLSYAAARFGAYRSVLAWELMDGVDESWAALKSSPERSGLGANEVDIARRARRDVQEWAEEMALHLRGMDQHEHPIGISAKVSPATPWAGLESVEHLDWIGVDALTFSADKSDNDEAARIYAWTAAAREPGRGHRPMMIGSVQLPAKDAKAGRYSGSLLLHNTIFAALAAGHFGAPLIDSAQLVAGTEARTTILGELSAAALFAAGSAETMRGTSKELPRDFVNTFESPGGVKVRVAGRVARRGVAAWIQDTRSVWSNPAEPPEVAETELRLPPLTEGEYAVYWIDTRSGAIVQTTAYTAPAKKIEAPAEPFVVRTPKFKRDIALVAAMK